MYIKEEVGKKTTASATTRQAEGRLSNAFQIEISGYTEI